MSARIWTCQGCGAMGVQTTRARLRKWCSESCRKRTLYGGTCVDCGAPTNGSDGRGPDAPKRCIPCNAGHLFAEHHKWILASLREWHERFGEPPTAPDWHPSLAIAKGQQWRVDRRATTGRDWPSATSVHAHFGSWNDGVAAAGLTPRTQGTKRIDRWAA